MSNPQSRETASKTPGIILCSLALVLVAACGLGLDVGERLARAEAAFAAGDTRAAIIDAKNVLLEQPDNVDARLLLGRASLLEGDAVTAEKELRRAAELGVDREAVIADIARAMLAQGRLDELVEEVRPEDFAETGTRLELLQILGEAELYRGNAVAARKHFQAILAADASDAPAQLGVANSYLAEGNPGQARATLQQVLELSPEHVPAWLFSGRLHLMTGNHQAAARDFTQALERAQSGEDSDLRAEALFGLAESAFAAGDVEGARKHAAALSELRPNALITLQTNARLAIVEEDWGRAEEIASEVLRRAPENDMARTMLGLVHMQNGNFAQAEMYLSATVASQPGNANARRLLAEVRLRMDKSAEAEEALAPLLDEKLADARSLAMAARVSFSTGDFDSAVEYLERSATVNPASSSGLDLALAYLMSDRIEEAREQLAGLPEAEDETGRLRRDVLEVLTEARGGGAEAAVAASAELARAWPDKALAHVLHGAFLAATDRVSAARIALERAIAIEPDNVNARRYAARFELQQGELETARGHLGQVLEVQPGDVSAMLAMGAIEARAGNADGARDWFERARDQDPDALLPRLLLGRYYLAVGEVDEAAAMAESALALSPEAADAHHTLGLVYLRRDEPGPALEAFGKAVDLAPENRDYRLGLARAYAAGGQVDRARRLLGESGNDALEHLPTGIMLANAQARSGDMDAAFETARRLRETHPESAAPIALEGELHALGGDYDRAAQLYDDALALGRTKRLTARAYHIRRRGDHANVAQPLERYLEERPRDTEIRLLLAQHFHENDLPTRAAAEYASVLEQAPENFVALNNLAWLYSIEGDPRAEEIARRARELAPDNASVADTLGWILVQQGDLEEGIAILRDALDRSDRPEIRYHLAAALAESGDNATARTILEEALEANGDFPSRDEARALLASL